MGETESDSKADRFQWKPVVAALVISLIVPAATVFFGGGRIVEKIESVETSTGDAIAELKSELQDQKVELKAALTEQKTELQISGAQGRADLQRSLDSRADALSTRLNNAEEIARRLSDVTGRQDERLTNLRTQQVEAIQQLRDELDTRGASRDRQFAALDGKLSQTDARLSSLEKGQADDRVAQARIESQLAAIAAGQLQDRGQMAIIQQQLSQLIQGLGLDRQDQPRQRQR